MIIMLITITTQFWFFINFFLYISIWQMLLLSSFIINNRDAVLAAKEKRQSVFPKERAFQMCSVICHPEERLYHHHSKKINELHRFDAQQAHRFHGAFVWNMCLLSVVSLPIIPGSRRKNRQESRRHHSQRLHRSSYW